MPKIAHLRFNDYAPDLELLDVESQTVRLSSLWNKRVLILAFTRHFGCPQCKEMVDILAHSAKDFKSAKLSLAVVTQGSPDDTKNFCAERGLEKVCLSDPQRTAYQAYGLERATIWQTFISWHVWQSNNRLKKERGWTPELPPLGQDAMQMSGTFVIGTDGRIRLPYYYDDIADHPPVDLLLRGVMGMNWDKPFEGPVAP